MRRIVFLVIATLLVIGLVLPGCAPSTLTIFSIAEGNVFIMKAGTTSWIEAKVGMSLETGDSVKTGDSSRAKITFFDGSTIQLQAGTEIQIASLDISTNTGSTTIILEQMIGSIIFRVIKIVDPASRYEIVTPTGEVGVRGSVVQVYVIEDGTTWAINLEGDIWAVAQSVELQIPEGQQCIISPGQPPELTDFWQQQTDGLYGGVVNRLAIDSSGSIFAGTYGAGIFRSIDGGESWNHTSYPRTIVNALAISSWGVIYADGFRSIDSGETWTQMSTSVYPSCFAINASGHIFAGTWNSGIFRSTDNGENWTQSNNGLTDTQVHCLAINSLGHIFAGTWNNGIFRSTDNGENWTQSNNGLTDTNVCCLAVNSLGHVFAGTYGQGVFYSTDSGESWESTGLTEGWVYSLAIDASDHVFAGIWRRGVWHSTDDGATWDSTGPADTAIRSLAINYSGHIFAGTDGEGVFRSTDSGESWTPVNRGLTNAWVRCLASNSLGDVFAGTWNNGIFRSTDNGQSWTNLGMTKKIFDSLAIGSSDRIFAGTGDIFVSSDNGENWIQKTLGLTNLVQSFAMNPLGYIFAGTQNGVFCSNDNGETWANVGLSDKNIGDVGTNSLGHVFAGVWGSGGGIYHSTDNGKTWVDIGLTDVNIRSIAFNSLGHVFVGTGFKGVFRSTDNGETWVNAGLENIDSYCLAVDSLDRIFVGTLGSGVFYSTNNGLSWQAISIGLTDSSVLSLVINSAGYLFAGTQSGVFRSVNPIY